MGAGDDVSIAIQLVILTSSIWIDGQSLGCTFRFPFRKSCTTHLELF